MSKKDSTKKTLEGEYMEVLKDRRQSGLCMDRWAIRRDVGNDIIHSVESVYGDWNTFLFEMFGIVADEFQTKKELDEAIERLKEIGFPLNYGNVVKNKSSLIGAAKKFIPDISWNTYANRVTSIFVGRKKHSRWTEDRVKHFIIDRYQKGLPLGSYKLSRDGFNQPMRVAKGLPGYPGNWRDFVQEVLQSIRGKSCSKSSTTSISS